MDLLAQELPLTNNPLDLLEELVSANDWIHARSSDSELMVQVSGQWCDYNLCSVWEPELGAMYFTCELDVKVPQMRRAAVCELVATMNERLWLGHFDINTEENSLMFRHTVPLRGTRGISVEQLEDLMDTALLECERLFPAVQMVVWGGRQPAEAVSMALMETVGEA